MSLHVVAVAVLLGRFESLRLARALCAPRVRLLMLRAAHAQNNTQDFRESYPTVVIEAKAHHIPSQTPCSTLRGKYFPL